MENMIIIGEKINGFVPKTGAALESHDVDYIKEIAVAQSEMGADYLDCCPASQEEGLERMRWMVDAIQEACDTPICLDDPNPDILVEAMGWCKRPGIINSVSVAGDKMEKILPLIAGTKWGVVVMLDDENGIPKDAAGRIAVYERVLAEAEKYGIKDDQMYIDPLVETLGTNPESLLTFVEVCRKVKKLRPRIHITSGLSNISYGLPARKYINMPFMVLAMEAGMDSAIVDPLNRDMMGCIFGTSALLSDDEYCIEYIGGYREGVFGAAKK